MILTQNKMEFQALIYGLLNDLRSDQNHAGHNEHYHVEHRHRVHQGLLCYDQIVRQVQRSLKSLQKALGLKSPDS